MDLLVAALPLLLLIVLMGKPRPWPAILALPVAALAAWLLRLAWFATPPDQVHAAVVSGVLTVSTPIAIVWGAVLLFTVLDRCGALAAIRAWLDALSPHPVAQAMLVAWAFSFLIEGASGFGTPAALAAPILVGCGFAVLPAVACCLILNSVPVVFGAVGTPIWFGLGKVGLEAEELHTVGIKAALIAGAAAFVLVPLAMRLLIDRATLRGSLGFVLLSILSCVVPYVLMALVGVEFPTLVGGACGLAVTAWTARSGIGLGPVAGAPARPAAPVVGVPWRALAPLLGIVLLLVVTRVPAFGLRGWLVDDAAVWSWRLGTLGEFGISRSFSLSLRDLLGSDADWTHRTLYVPSLLPFVPMALLAAALFGFGARATWGATRDATVSLARPALALVAALALVELLKVGEASSSVSLIGSGLAHAAGAVWVGVAPVLGVLGAFVAGSATISNLTFGAVQAAAAERLQLEPTRILALQAAGAAIGNMVCIHNIVAAAAVVGLKDQEGGILRRTAPPMVAAVVVMVVVALLM